MALNRNIRTTSQLSARVIFARVVSTAVLLWLTLASLAQAHEVFPSVADMTQEGNTLTFEVEGNIESLVAGIDLSTVTDTNDAEQAQAYDDLRALGPDEMAAAMEAFWPELASGISIMAGDTALTPELVSVTVPEVGDVDNVRNSTFTFTAELPSDTDTVQFGWAPAFGDIVLRQQGVEQPYDGFLQNGAMSDPIALSGGFERSGFMTFIDYIPVGVDHIVPKGLDHILFVLGLFFLSTNFRALLWQVTAFTLAHTITLALAALGYVTVPGSIVEPLIALSIVYVAVENLYTTGLSRWRPFIIFGFGLLHGLGFASVLAEFGLPDSAFVPALIGFNVGVELGQLAVIAVAFICVKVAIDYDTKAQGSKPLSAVFLVLAAIVMALIIPLSGMEGGAGDLLPLLVIVAILLGFSATAIAADRYENYREMVALPSSILIAIVAAYWCIERVFL